MSEMDYYTQSDIALEHIYWRKGMSVSELLSPSIRKDFGISPDGLVSDLQDMALLGQITTEDKSYERAFKDLRTSRDMTEFKVFSDDRGKEPFTEDSKFVITEDGMEFINIYADPILDWEKGLSKSIGLNGSESSVAQLCYQRPMSSKEMEYISGIPEASSYRGIKKLVGRGAIIRREIKTGAEKKNGFIVLTGVGHPYGNIYKLTHFQNIINLRAKAEGKGGAPASMNILTPEYRKILQYGQKIDELMEEAKSLYA